MTHHQVSALMEYLRQIALHTRPDDLGWRINLALALGTFLTFAATAYMAWMTARLARDTVKGSVVADIHHQEAQSGLVVWMGDKEIHFLADKIEIHGYLANVGPGAATTIMIQIQGPNEETDTSIGVFIPSLASGQEYPPVEMSSSGVPQRRKVLWTFGLPASKPKDELLNQGARFKIKYSTIYELQRTTWYPVGGKYADPNGTHLSYTQEFIELNRDKRLSSLLSG